MTVPKLSKMKKRWQKLLDYLLPLLGITVSVLQNCRRASKGFARDEALKISIHRAAATSQSSTSQQSYALCTSSDRTSTLSRFLELKDADTNFCTTSATVTDWVVAPTVHIGLMCTRAFISKNRGVPLWCSSVCSFLQSYHFNCILLWVLNGYR